MLAVDVPSTSATRSAPRRSRTSAIASSIASCCSASQARRLLRHSQRTNCSGSGDCSRPSTRPIQVSSRASPKSLRRNPPRRARSASACASRPRPSVVVAVYAGIASGGIGAGRDVCGIGGGDTGTPAEI
jgi:hypothetical protein